ncbi:hypothetical protein [Sutcliffiella rhizosphaerae]|uniref:Uncharacterized protein n=1 Tax=Sutcliffiella rhizosphaerae TaxID=2880967 RepID=A0ABM8YQE3_9BACI|nr:hypothetical protein [Sutcliffiella rhizosphaerae]CAG9622027.1 hypothetical protein BACCIP111883_02818 [Sutcliffiella rhizosphaerae]
MFRTHYKGKELIIRIKQNLTQKIVSNEEIYNGLLHNLDKIYHLNVFAVVLEENLVVGKTDRTEVALITIQSVIPKKNILGL